MENKERKTNNVSISERSPFTTIHLRTRGEDEERGKKKTARRWVDTYCHLLAERSIYEEKKPNRPEKSLLD